MSVALMTDHPLKRWREHETITQAELARRCGVKTNTVARWERGEQIPRGVYLARLLEVTGLSAEAIVLPEHFLQRHPDFLRPAKPPGRPRKRPPPEGGPDA